MTDFAEKERLTVVKFLSWEWCTFQIRYGFIFISLRSSKGTIPLLTPYWQSPLAFFRRLFSKLSISIPFSNDGLAPECSFELFRCVLWTLESLVSSYKIRMNHWNLLISVHARKAFLDHIIESRRVFLFVCQYRTETFLKMVILKWQYS